MDARQVAGLRRLFAGTALDDEIVEFATALGAAPQPSGGLFVVGTPTNEPWHFVAYLAEQAAASNRTELAPTWIRWQPPANAPRHLAIGTDRLRDIARHETILVIAQDSAPERLLDLVADGHKQGALVMALERSNPELVDLADEVLAVPESMSFPCFDVIQHVVTEIAPGDRAGTAHVRGRMRRLLDARTSMRATTPPLDTSGS